MIALLGPYSQQAVDAALRALRAEELRARTRADEAAARLVFELGEARAQARHDAIMRARRRASEERAR